MAQNDRTYRGPRKTTADIDDSSSVTGGSPAYHIRERFRRYFKLLARMHAIKDITGLDYIVRGGASTGQDVRGTTENPACHMIRVGEVNPKLKEINRPLYNALTNFVGHTQYAPAAVNRWDNIGGAIDRFQSANLNGLDRMSYEGNECSAIEKEKIQNMLNEMKKIIIQHSLHTGGARKWIQEHSSDEGLEMLYEYMKSKFDGVKTGEFVKQWGETVNR